MKRFLSFLAIATLMYFLPNGVQAQFSNDNLAILVAAASANNTTVSVVEINKVDEGQTAIQTIGIPGTGDDAIRVSGSATSTLYAANSADGSLFCFTGHKSDATGVNANTILPRAVVTINNAGDIGIATTYTGASGNQTRCATTLNNTDFYIADQGGQYTNGATSASPTGNFRGMKTFGGVVYLGRNSSTATTIEVATTDALTGGTITGLPGLSNNNAHQDFYLISSGASGSDFDVLYILRASSNTVGTIAKYSLVSGSWVANGTYTTTFGGFGLAAEKAGAGANLYVSTGQGALTANSVRKLTDAAGYNATIDITGNIVLFTTGTGTIIKGLAFAPASAAGSPQLTVNPNQLSGFSYLEGSGPSASQSFAIGGSDLTPETGNITVQGTTNYEVSLNNSTFQNSVSFGYTGGEVVSQTVWVRLKAGLGAGTYNNENVTISGGGAAQKTVACNGTVSSASVITVGSVNPFGNQEVNTVSAQQNYLVSAVNLGDELEIYAPAGFEISKVGGLDFTPSNPILLSPIGGTVAPTSIYVRFAPTQAIAYSGNITHDSPGAFTQNVPVSGTGIYGEPTNYPTDFSASAPAHNAVDVSWTDASTGVLPDSYLIKGSTVGYGDIADPVDGVSESNALLVRNVAQGIENYTFTGLQGSTTYYFKIYPYTGSGASINYKTSGSVPQADATTPAGPALSEVIMPQYMQGFNGTNNNRTPFAYRLNFENLNPNATYRYINQMVLGTNPSTDGGAGNIIFVNPDNTFSRTTSTSFSIAGQYGEFTTDAAGSFTGWFITEPTGNARFTPGNEVYVRVRLNDGAGGTSAVTYLTSTSPIKVINYGDQASLNDGTGVYGPSDSDPKNFVFLYDNSSGSGRPITGSFVEDDGTSGGTTYPAFYQNNVNENEGYWGAIIPNVNNNGILRLEFRDLTTGNIDYAVTDSDGIWNGSDTKNPGGGLNAMLLEPDMTKDLNVLFFLEGPYNGTFMNTDLLANNLLPGSQPYDLAPWNYAGTENVLTFPLNVVDWVLVELRDATAPELATPATKLAGWPKAMFVRTDGQLVDLDGFLPEIGNPVVNNNLYIVIRHRNHVDIMSADGLLLTGNTYSYDFTGSVNQAYGGSLGYKLLNGGACGMASGDMDADGKVFASDFVEWATDSGLGDIYSLGDLDFDGNVFASDFVLWAGNSGLDYPVEAIQPDVPVFVTQVPDKE